MQEETWESSHGNGPNGRQEGVRVEWRRQRKEERGQNDENYLFIYFFNMGNGDG
jgi:hypothetical protein